MRKNNRQHIHPEVMERYFVNRAGMAEDKVRELQEHLGQCALCREHFEQLERFYSDLEENLKDEPTEQDKEFAGRIITDRFFKKTSHILPFSQGRKTGIAAFDKRRSLKKIPFIYPIVRFAVFHPYQFIGANAAVMVAALGTFFILQHKPAAEKDRNPEYARAQKEFLVVYNKSGQELWKKYIGRDYDEASLKLAYGHTIPDKIIRTVDINQDGKKEILAILGHSGNQEIRNKIVCYDPRGLTAWTYTFNREMVFGTSKYSDEYVSRQFLIKDFNSDGTPDIIASYNHSNYFPSSIIRLDALTGELREEYWHNGTIYFLDHLDLNKDGRDEIIFGGTNNTYNLAAMGVLNAGSLSGHAPVPAGRGPAGHELNASQKYILFPRSDLAGFSVSARNHAMSILYPDENTIEVYVNDEGGDLRFGLYFILNHTLECLQVDAHDVFKTYHRKLEAEGKLAQPIDARYFEALRQGVKYWDGEGFISQVPGLTARP